MTIHEIIMRALLFGWGAVWGFWALAYGWDCFCTQTKPNRWFPFITGISFISMSVAIFGVMG